MSQTAQQPDLSSLGIVALDNPCTVLLNSELEWQHISYLDDDYEAYTNRFVVRITVEKWLIYFDGHKAKEGRFLSDTQDADSRKRIAQKQFTTFLSHLI